MRLSAALPSVGPGGTSAWTPVEQVVPGLPGVQDAAQDSTASPDSVAALEEVTGEVSNAVDLLLSGDIDSFSDVMIRAGQYLISNFLPDLFAAIVVFGLMYVFYRVLRRFTNQGLERSRRVDAGLQSLLLKTLSVVVWVFIVIMVLSQFGVNVTALLAGLSIAGIAVGFAAKDSLENYISGITILIDKPFRVGDQVEVEGTYGTVEEITLRSTRLQTQNNEVVVMPNVLMINQKLTNHALHGRLRVEVSFGIAYKESPEEAREVVMKLVEGDDRILKTPAPSVVVVELGDSSVNMRLRFFIMDTGQEIPIRSEYTEKVFYALREADIEIPFPHLQLFVDDVLGLDPADVRRRLRSGNSDD
ncbi:MAG: mechanosensitive ion channel [Rhodothermales bacterium]|nr:mechanosensitive ion channel [Rhodothermales bacterium]